VTRRGGPQTAALAVPGQRVHGHDTQVSPAREDPDREYRRRLTDDEVRALGYTHRDDRGYWQKPTRPAPDRRERHRAIGARRCLTCGVDPLEGDHGYWCPATPSVDAALRDARDLQAAIAWQPPERDPVLNPKCSPAEREQLGRLFDALVAAREQARGETPRGLWSIREWRSREGTA
jgi:hypothetical protein